MITIIDSLTLEHTVFGHLFHQIESLLPQLTTPQEAQLLGRLVEGILASHGDREENLAYAALDQFLANQNELDCLYQDHEEIDGRLERLRSAATLPEARQLLKEALHASRQHFKREELLIFPKLGKAFDEETLSELSEAWKKWDAVPLKPRSPARPTGAIPKPAPVARTYQRTQP